MSTSDVRVKISANVTETTRALAAMADSMNSFAARLACGAAWMTFSHLRTRANDYRDERLLDRLADARDRYYLRRDLLELA